MCKGNRKTAVLVFLGLLLIPMPARALITTLTPLQDVLKQSTFIVTARVESVNADKPAMVLVVEDDLKGQSPLRKFPVLLKGDAEAKKRNHVPQILKRIAPRLPLLLFILQQDKKYTALAYTNGTWFQIVGADADGAVRWTLTHGEPYLRKTFKGSTSELKQIVVDGLAGKKDPPKPDAKEKPGFGPEISTENKSENPDPAALSRSQTLPGNEKRKPAIGSTLFAVIPTVFVGGLVAILAMLLPVVFGGLMLVLRRWLAALTVLSINSTLYLLQELCRPWLVNSRWGTSAALWLTMAVITLLGILWAWRRQVSTLAADSEQQRKVPSGVELITLVVLSVLCLVLTMLALPRSSGPLDLLSKMLLMFSAGLGAATLHALYGRWRDRAGALPGEGVLLWTMLLMSSLFASTFRVTTHETEQPRIGTGESGLAAEQGPYRVAWRFQPQVEHSWIASSPQVDDERVYIGVVMPSAFQSSGALYCVDRKTGREIWMFNDDGGMKDVFSSPCLADGRVYIGEGFHQHADCKLYCLDAATGKKRWDFATSSHIESTPCVAAGKVYFGAGDDGLYCLDSVSGKKLWHVEGLHVDCNPLVIDNRLYGGSGVGDGYKDTVLFCLNADTGERIWRMPVDLPAWGMAVVQGEYLYAGVGNGNFLMSAAGWGNAEKPAGAMLCLERATGKRVWRYDVSDGVLGRVCVDEQYVWFAARDHYCYCLDRHKGVLIWKTDLGSAEVASPALVGQGRKKSLYVASSGGLVSRLDARTGKIAWTFEVAKDAGQPAAVFSSPLIEPCEDRRGEARIIWFGSGLGELKRGILYCLEERLVEKN